MRWRVLVLREVDEDLEALARSGAVDPDRVEGLILEEFEDPFKAERLHRFLESGAATSHVDRLAASTYPPSIRLRVLHDLRVTAWCFPAQRHAVVTQVFRKSSDPRYKRAVRIHDERLNGYFGSLHEFVERKRKR